MTKIIGHRGAAGLALENSSESLKRALDSQVDAIEFDVHFTIDRQIVVLHDEHTGRIANERLLVQDNTLAELQALELKNGQRIMTLDEVLAILDGAAVIIDIKGTGMAEELLRILAKHPAIRPSFASFHVKELADLRRLDPAAKLYALEHRRPLKIVFDAQKIQANGIGLNKWILNPLTYYLLKRRHLELYVYTVNHRLTGRSIARLYPRADICTDYPHLFTADRSTGLKDQ